MSSISSVSNSSNAWATTGATRSAPKDKLFSLVDSDSSGGVDSTELQTLMDDVTKKTGVANSNTAAELMTKLDTNGDGTLDGSELHKGITSIVQLPTTMEFAQARNDSSNDNFAKLDTDGDGKLSKTEFSAGRPSGPPPANATSSSDSTTYDSLDTNKDGIVSAAEAAAGQANGTGDTLQALLKAMDTDKDGKLSNTEADTFVQQVSTAVDTLQKSSGSTDSIDLNQLAQQVLKQYTQVAAGSASATTGSTVSLRA